MRKNKFASHVAKVTGFSALMHRIQLRRRPLRVITYHSILSSESLYHQLCMLKDLRFFPLAVEDFLTTQWHRNQEGIPLLVTFDDGTEDHLRHGVPALEKAGMKGIFFIIADRVGRKGYMQAHHLRELAAAGHLVGSHSFTHPRFSAINRDEMKKELVDSRKLLEDMTGKPVETFAFPYGRLGDFNFAAVEEVFSAGYKFCFSAVRGWNQNPGAGSFLFRDSLQPEWSKNETAFFMSGAAQFVYHGMVKVRDLSMSVMPLGFEYAFYPRWRGVARLLIALTGLVDLPARVRFQRALKELKKNRVEVLVDIGTGLGLFPFYVVRRRFAKKAMGIEINPEAVVQAREVARRLENIRVHFEEKDIEKDALGYGFADCVVCLETLQYMQDPFEALNRMVALLTDGGLLLLRFHEKDVRDRDLFRRNTVSGEEVAEHLKTQGMTIYTFQRGPGRVMRSLFQMFDASLKFRPLLLLYPLMVAFSRFLPYGNAGEYVFIKARKKS